MDPMTLALLISAGSQVASGVAGGLLNKPEIPNVFEPALRQSQAARARIEELLSRRLDNLEASQAARGVTGSGGAGDREALIRSSNNALSDIDASVAGLLTEAGNKQRMLEFQAASQQYGARQQGISNLATGASNVASLYALTASPTALADASVNPLEAVATAPPVLQGVDSPLPVVPSNTASPNPLNLRPTVDPITGRVMFDLNLG